MPRPDKVQAVADIKERLEGARAVFVAEYAGLSVKQQQALRRGLRGSEAEFKVVKMTLARRAAQELGFDELADLFVGPTGLAFADGDAVTSAKALKVFAGDNEQLIIKGGLLGGQLLTPERVSELADLEPREVQLAKIAGAFQAPMAKMAGLLAAMPRNLASMMQQLIDKKPPDEPAAEVVADEAPAEEAAAVEAVEAPAEEVAPEAAAEEAVAEEAVAEDQAPAAEVADSETETSADKAEEE